MKTPVLTFSLVVAALVLMSASPVSENLMTTSGSHEKNVKPISAGFAFFRIHHQTRDGVTVTWGMTSESGVAGYIVQRTYEDPTDPYAFWEDIGTMPASSSRSYKWTDENVFPGFISYRIVAMMSVSGQDMVSDVLTLHIISH